MRAYHNNPGLKIAILSQLANHREADEIVKGQYWENGKGCAVGCTLHSSNHAEYETKFGIPLMLAKLEDTIFEGLPNHLAKEWPERFMNAVNPGANLSLIGWKFQHWLLTDISVNPGIGDNLVSNSVSACAKLILVLAQGDAVTKQQAESAARSAESAARSAESAARSAGWSAESARSAWSAWSAEESAAWSAEESAAWSARSAARSAESAARSAWSAARSAAESAAWSARSAGWSAESAWSAWSAEESAEHSYAAMANKLVQLIENA